MEAPKSSRIVAAMHTESLSLLCEGAISTVGGGESLRSGYGRPYFKEKNGGGGFCSDIIVVS